MAIWPRSVQLFSSPSGMEGDDTDGAVIDLMSLLEDGQPEALALVPRPLSDDAIGIAEPIEPSLNLDQATVNNLNPARHVSNISIPSMAGKVGQGRHGGVFERSLLALHMRNAKVARKNHDFRLEVADMLQDSCFTKDGKLMTVRAKATAAGMVLIVHSKSRKGNRYKRAIAWATFLQAAYGKLRRTAHIAQALDVSQRSVSFMTTLVGQVFMNQQMIILAKLVAMASTVRPAVLVRQIKWDETQLLCSVDADKSGHRVQSTWQVMAVREKIVLAFSNGQSIVLRLVMPPVVLLASGAHHIYYALRYHPVFVSTNRLLDLLAKLCERRICIWESDGAYSNERLMAHVFRKTKSENPRHLNLHCRCQNHQTQLVNVALLACVGNDLLSRLYGMAVFLRNLGYWLRMRQAFAEWLSEELVFKQEIHDGDLTNHVTPAPVLRELIDYIRLSRNMEGKDHQSFERKVAAFLDMWNGNVAGGSPTHICSHSALPQHHRHCRDRAEAIQKMINSFLDLFMILPGIPAPNKWSSMFGCTDFVLSGAIINKWLPTIFYRAFKNFQFTEFDEKLSTTDPKLIETLAFHAVNGRRHRASLSFLQSDPSMWSVSLLAVAMETTRALTWFWLGCLGYLNQLGALTLILISSVVLFCVC